MLKRLKNTILIIFILITIFYAYPRLFIPPTVMLPNINELGFDLYCSELDKLGVEYNINEILSEDEILYTVPSSIEVSCDTVVEIYINVDIEVKDSYIGRRYTDVLASLPNHIVEYVDEGISGMIVNIEDFHGTLKVYVVENLDFYSMPNFIGSFFSEVRPILEKLHINYELIYVDMFLGSDMVVYQSIPEGDLMCKTNDSTLILYLSKY